MLATCCLGEAPLDKVCVEHCLPSPSRVKKKAIWIWINSTKLQPMERRLERGKPSVDLPEKCHILLPSGITEIYEAARLRHNFSTSITPTLAS